MRCHHSNSRNVHCACGNHFQWVRGINYAVCTQCRRIHERGPEGSKSKGACDGLGKMSFGRAAQLAQVEFDIMMYRLGFEVIPDKKNTISLTCHNTPRSRKTGFSVSFRSRYAGSESSL